MAGLCLLLYKSLYFYSVRLDRFKSLLSKTRCYVVFGNIVVLGKWKHVDFIGKMHIIMTRHQRNDNLFAFLYLLYLYSWTSYL